MPGEVGRPGGAPTPPLDRAPGERYRDPATSASMAPPATANRLLAFLFGLLAACGTAAAWGAVASIVDIEVGLLVVAAIGGLLIGGAVAWGAWSGRGHVPARSVSALAAALGAVSWLGGSYLAYLLAKLLLPASDLTFQQRLDAQPFLDWLTPQLSGFDYLSIVLLIVLAWRAARR